ncbi:MAG: hypothetical protein WCA35_09525 [Kovacikia sp.]
MTTISVQTPNRIPAPVRMLIRPMLFLALSLHALLLFIPLPSENKLKEADDKKDPLKITQVPTAQPASSKPKPKPAIKLTGKPAIVPKTTTLSLKPASSAITLTPSPPKPALIPSSSSLTEAASTAPPPSTAPTSRPENGETAQNAPPSKPSEAFKGDPAETLQGFLESLSRAANGKDSGGSSSANKGAPLEEITRPELLFKSTDDRSTAPSTAAQKVALEGLPGLDKQPWLVTFPLEDNLNLYSFYQKTLEPKLITIFEDISEVGDYGDGPLYKLARGNYALYLSLMPPKKAVGAIISVWTKDPRPKQDSSPTNP